MHATSPHHPSPRRARYPPRRARGGPLRPDAEPLRAWQAEPRAGDRGAVAERGHPRLAPARQRRAARTRRAGGRTVIERRVLDGIIAAAANMQAHAAVNRLSEAVAPALAQMDATLAKLSEHVAKTVAPVVAN